MKALLLILSLVLLAMCENNNFDYGKHGDDWGKTWQDCDPTNDDKNQQSPIELSDQIASSGQSFLFSNFYKADAAVSFLNTTVYLKSTNSFGEIYTKTINGDIVVLKATEIRFRTHSEHKVYDQYYDLEMQIFFTEVYPSVRNERLGLALLFEPAEGQTNKILKTIKDASDDKQTKVSLDLSSLLNNDQPFDFWYYLGSATIPNCKNGALKWIVSKKIFKMSQQERDFFWELFHKDMDGNYRRIQPMRGNKVNYFHFSSK